MARVLVCDDERHILRLLQVNLERQDHHVCICDNGVECLRRLRQESFDLLMIDGDHLGFPSALEVLNEIDQDPTISVRVIVMGDDPRNSSGPSSGPPPVVVSKPFNPAELLRML